MSIRLANPPAPVLPDLSRPPAFFEDAVEDPAPDGAFFWTTLGKIDKGVRSGGSHDPYRHHLCIYRHKEDADRGAREPRPYWTWDGLPPFHITPEQAVGLARKRGFAGAALKVWENDGWTVLRTWDA